MLKKKINQKLKSEKGASIFFGLLLFLVASMVSIVILDGAVTTVKRVESDRTAEQNYLTCSSAAKLLRDEIVNSQVAKIKTVTEQKRGNSVISTQTTITWRGTSVNSGTSGGTSDEFATYFQKYIQDYCEKKDAEAPGPYTKKFTVSVPSNLKEQKEKEAFDEVTAELTIEEAAKVNENNPAGYDISVKLVTGTGSDTCQMFLKVSGKASPEKIETTETSGGTGTGTGTWNKKTVITTTTTTYTWEPLKIIYGDKELNTEE